MRVISPTSRHWHAGSSGLLSPAQAFWLQRPGALTNGLRALGQVDLRVTREFACAVPSEEAHALQVPKRTQVWVREVVMAIDGIDRVSARSLTPLLASHGVWSGIRRLNTRPLADMLYGDTDIVRSPFAWRQLMPGDPFYGAVRGQGGVAYVPNRAGCLLARRSVFWRKRQPLIVAECFLPAFWNIAQAHRP
ncbi:MAG: chorismate lyase [Burkholderiaceae bacterium]|nr:chorismate lyase [Burkholderiaceae bacterium]